MKFFASLLWIIFVDNQNCLINVENILGALLLEMFLRLNCFEKSCPIYEHNITYLIILLLILLHFELVLRDNKKLLNIVFDAIKKIYRVLSNTRCSQLMATILKSK